MPPLGAIPWTAASGASSGGSSILDATFAMDANSSVAYLAQMFPYGRPPEYCWYVPYNISLTFNQTQGDLQTHLFDQWRMASLPTALHFEKADLQGKEVHLEYDNIHLTMASSRVPLYAGILHDAMLLCETFRRG